MTPCHWIRAGLLFSHASAQPQKTPVRGVPGSDFAGVVSLDDPGLHLIAYRSTSVLLELDAAKFESYLRSEGLEGIIDERSRRNEGKAKGRELYSRCVKSLLRAGVSGEETGFDRVLDFPVELVPELNPYGLTAGDELPVRILREGKPLAEVLVVAYPHGDPARSVRQRSDEEGRVKAATRASGSMACQGGPHGADRAQRRSRLGKLVGVVDI